MTPNAVFPWIRRAIVVLGGSLLVAGGGLREDELDCEQAVAHLASCCPAFDPSLVDCTYSSTCGITYPALNVDESQCIVGLSCEAIVAAGLCERTQDLSSTHIEDDGGVSGTHPEVCP